jgi:Uma2 family endonuclease
MATLKQQSGVRQRRWSKSEYYRLGELHFFHGQRVELIEGRIILLSPKSPLHCAGVCQVAELLRGLFGTGFCVRMHMPLDLNPETEPEPDVCVVVGDPPQYFQAHPTTAALIVEVSDTTVSYDRRHKGSLYARANIADYWLINLPRRRLEVYRAPIVDPTRPFGHRYSSRTDLLPGATVSPLALPQQTIAVSDLLP